MFNRRRGRLFMLEGGAIYAAGDFSLRLQTDKFTEGTRRTVAVFNPFSGFGFRQPEVSTSGGVNRAAPRI
jgi:hypothetical protein